MKIDCDALQLKQVHILSIIVYALLTESCYGTQMDSDSTLTSNCRQYEERTDCYSVS